MTTTINLLVRGQSNALLFVDWGGAGRLEQALEAKLGDAVDINLLAGWADPSSATIYSGIAFMDWPKDGQQQGLLNFLGAQSADVRDNPTVTVCMHNEYDQADMGLTAEDWMAAVRADAGLVRGALGQDASTTPYEFVPIRYN